MANSLYGKSSVRLDHGRRPRYALLAAQPQTQRQTGSSLLWRPHTHPANRGPARTGDSSRKYLGDYERISAAGDSQATAASTEATDSRRAGTAEYGTVHRAGSTDSCDDRSGSGDGRFPGRSPDP